MFIEGSYIEQVYKKRFYHLPRTGELEKLRVDEVLLYQGTVDLAWCREGCQTSNMGGCFPVDYQYCLLRIRRKKRKMSAINIISKIIAMAMKYS